MPELSRDEALAIVVEEAEKLTGQDVPYEPFVTQYRLAETFHWPEKVIKATDEGWASKLLVCRRWDNYAQIKRHEQMLAEHGTAAAPASPPRVTERDLRAMANSAGRHPNTPLEILADDFGVELVAQYDA